MKNIEKIVVHWWDTANGRYTCHLNTPGLLYKESLLGEVFFRNGSWWYTLNNPETNEVYGPFRNSQAAKRALQEDVGGDTIENCS